MKDSASIVLRKEQFTCVDCGKLLLGIDALIQHVNAKHPEQGSPK